MLWKEQKVLAIVAVAGVFSLPLTAGGLTSINNQMLVEPRVAVARYQPDGSLDSSFAGDGKVLTNLGSGGAAVASAMAMDAAGRILVAGFAEAFGQRQIAVIRYTPDGSLDPSFGGNGKVLTNPGSSGDAEATAIAIDGAGRIVVAGFAEAFGKRQFALLRYNPDGILDRRFGGDGRVLTRVSSTGDAEAHAIVIDSDGRIVVAGFAEAFGQRQFAVVRYTPDGSLDRRFGRDGKVTTRVSSTGDAQAQAIASDSDGKIVAAGFAEVFGNRQFALVRYTPDGSLDPLFNVTGKVLTSFTLLGGDAAAFDLTLDETGRIVVAGVAEVGLLGVTFLRFAVARYNAAGLLDRTFGGNGTVITAFGSGGDAAAHAITVDETGKIVVAGFAQVLGDDRFALVRYNADGQLDQSFGDSGRVLTDFRFEAGILVKRAIVNAISVDREKRIVAAGFADTDS